MNTSLNATPTIVFADSIKPDQKKNRCHQGNTSAVKRFRPLIFPWNVWLCCQVHSKLCEYSRATSKTHSKRREVVLGSRSEHGLQHLKGSIIGRGGPRLFPFRCSHLRTNASPVSLGAILLQDRQQGERKPIAYTSRSLTPTERRYLQIEREALGCIRAVECLHNYLFGVQFTILTDNSPF